MKFKETFFTHQFDKIIADYDLPFPYCGLWKNEHYFKAKCVFFSLFLTFSSLLPPLMTSTTQASLLLGL